MSALLAESRRCWDVLRLHDSLRQALGAQLRRLMAGRRHVSRGSAGRAAAGAANGASCAR
ncbi:hypothetical protein RR46_03258 [Papilio xuthus]|uniref:Uncharacterized protein n=1 Tax=Papilio xuthus TaxID=66420 RepID=A0A194QGL6_PAPXU|nr:hypothetical protein RR46_03258 [Papilio xuthus]